MAEKGNFSAEDEILRLPLKPCLESGIKFILEKLLVLHRVRNETILIEEALPFIFCLGLDSHLNVKAQMPDTRIWWSCILSGFRVLRGSFEKRAESGKTGESDLRKMSPQLRSSFR